MSLKSPILNGYEVASKLGFAIKSHFKKQNPNKTKFVEQIVRIVMYEEFSDYAVKHGKHVYEFYMPKHTFEKLSQKVYASVLYAHEHRFNPYSIIKIVTELFETNTMLNKVRYEHANAVRDVIVAINQKYEEIIITDLDENSAYENEIIYGHKKVLMEQFFDNKIEYAQIALFLAIAFSESFEYYSQNANILKKAYKFECSSKMAFSKQSHDELNEIIEYRLNALDEIIDNKQTQESIAKMFLEDIAPKNKHFDIKVKKFCKIFEKKYPYNTEHEISNLFIYNCIKFAHFVNKKVENMAITEKIYDDYIEFWC